MGSPISSIIANLYIHSTEYNALASFRNVPHTYPRYVDHTFVVMKSQFKTLLYT